MEPTWEPTRAKNHAVRYVTSCSQLLQSKPQQSTGWYASLREVISQLKACMDNHACEWARGAPRAPTRGHAEAMRSRRQNRRSKAGEALTMRPYRAGFFYMIRINVPDA